MSWFQVPAIDDPVDRRNAPILQVALLVLGTIPPLLWLYRMGTGIPWRPGETLSLAISLVISALALWSVVLIRRARFQRAIRQLMFVVAALTIVSHAVNGMSVHVFQMPVQVLWLFIAGMMIGRSALWLMFGALVLALFLGAVGEARIEQEPADHLLGDAVIRSVMFLTIALVIDRSVAALRESLDEALARGRALELANAQLQAEMAAREQAQTRLLHAQKMEAVGRMASGLAHDFGHLLALVDGYAVQARNATGPQVRADALEGVSSAARRARAQVGKLMHFARQDAPVLEAFDAGEVLREVVPMLRQTLGAAVRLCIQPPAAPAMVRADREQFVLVLLNIAANAADAMPDGGSFTVTTEVDTAAGKVEIGMRDSGPGIADETLERVFEPFYTTKPQGDGAGLGLAVSRDLAVDWGGRLEYVAERASATEPRGAQFRLVLPLAAPCNPHRREAHQSSR